MNVPKVALTFFIIVKHNKTLNKRKKTRESQTG